MHKSSEDFPPKIFIRSAFEYRHPKPCQLGGIAAARGRARPRRGDPREFSDRILDHPRMRIASSWGGHGPSRSYATELGKVLDADISKADRMKIFGGNLRRICASIFRKRV